jgi:hypothetical protein
MLIQVEYCNASFAMGLQEQRRHRRVNLNCLVEISHPRYGTRLLQAKDFSDSGIYVILPDNRLPPIGTIVKGQVQGLNGEAPKIDMEIVRTDKGGMGLRFVKPEDKKEKVSSLQSLEKTENACSGLRNRNKFWRLATGDWRLATGDWRLATGDCYWYICDRLVVDIYCRSKRLRRRYGKLSPTNPALTCS